MSVYKFFAIDTYAMQLESQRKQFYTVEGKENWRVIMDYITPTLTCDEMLELTEDFAWYTVLIAVLVALGGALIAGAILFCIFRKKAFTGSWKYANGRGQVKIQCK